MADIKPIIATGTQSAFISQDGQLIAFVYASRPLALYIHSKLLCHASCRTCLSGTFDNCTSCSQGHIPVNAGINSLAPGVCQPMSEPCATYFKASTTNCTSCPAGRYLFKDTSNFGSCTPCTNTGLVQTNSVNCALCGDNCAACTGGGKSIVGLECVICATTCSQCASSPVDASKCTACYSSSQLPYLQSKICTNCTQTGYFKDGLNCTVCDSNCLTCVTSSKTCLTCHAGYIIENKTITCVNETRFKIKQVSLQMVEASKGSSSRESDFAAIATLKAEDSLTDASIGEVMASVNPNTRFVRVDSNAVETIDKKTSMSRIGQLTL